MPPLHPAATTAAATHCNIETAHHGAPDNVFLILRFAALKLYPTSTMGALFRQRHTVLFIDA